MPRIELNKTELEAEKQSLSEFLASPNAYADPDFGSKNKRFTELETLIGLENRRTQLQNNITEAANL